MLLCSINIFAFLCEEDIWCARQIKKCIVIILLVLFDLFPCSLRKTKQFQLRLFHEAVKRLRDQDVTGLHIYSQYFCTANNTRKGSFTNKIIMVIIGGF